MTPDIEQLVERARALPAGAGRRPVLGIVGAPGAGKSTLAARLVTALGTAGTVAMQVPMDGFHLADVALARLGRGGRKGAPDTFDPHGYAALLARLADHPDHTVHAPAFERDLEQPLAGAIGVGPEVELVVTEGNYLLLDEPGWRAVAEVVGDTWFVAVDDDLRRERLLARHVEFGKSPEAAEAWMARVDEPNARLVAASRDRADLVVTLG